MRFPREVAEPSAAGFVLAGGQSIRMGTDKALVEFAGKPLVAHALGILQAAGLEGKIAGAQSSLASYAPVIEDLGRGQGPLGGVCAAMASSPAQLAVFLPVDMPLSPPSLLLYLVHHARATGAAVTLPSISGYAQTFPAVVDRALLAGLGSRLTRGKCGCFEAFQAAALQTKRRFTAIPAEPLVQAGHIAHPDALPAAFWFVNANCSADVERAQSILTAFHRVS